MIFFKLHEAIILVHFHKYAMTLSTNKINLNGIDNFVTMSHLYILLIKLIIQ